MCDSAQSAIFLSVNIQLKAELAFDKSLGKYVIHLQKLQPARSASRFGRLTVGAHAHGSESIGANAAVTEVVTGNLPSQISGSATLAEAQAADLHAGKGNFNVHARAHPNDEISGQLSVHR
jgi:CHRD domain